MEREVLRNDLKFIEESVHRVRNEFDLGNPNLDVCDRLFSKAWSRMGKILRRRKEEGWPAR